MGLPEILIEFKQRAQTAVRRSENGIVAVILADDTKTGAGYESYVYTSAADVNTSQWSTVSRRYFNMLFQGAPNKVLVERTAPDEGYDNALMRLKNKSWNWLAIPGLANDDVETIGSWIIAQRSAKKTFKAVLPCTAAGYNPNDEGIVDFATEGIKVGAYSFTSNEYCLRIAGLLASLPMTESATYQVLAEVDSITESLTPDEDIDGGKLILINDGEKIKVARGVNSLHILSGDKTEDMKKIKIIDGMDLIRDDIRTTFEENYVGINNIYQNKLVFIAAVNQYFDQLVRQGVLYDEYVNLAEIDADAQRAWLAERYDVSGYSDDEILKARTGSYVFAKASIQFNDAIEDLRFSISME